MRKYLFAFLLGSVLHANPLGPSIVNGDVSFRNEGIQDLEIVASASSIIEWNSFSIDKQEKTTFLLPNKTAAVLNRVIGSEQSIIHGQISSNGQVLLINPQGILFGKESVIDTGSLIASTLDLQDSVFLNGKAWKFEGESLASIVNEGTISAGDLFLIGHEIENSGSIKGSEIGLLGCRECVIQPTGIDRIYIRTHRGSKGENPFASAFAVNDRVTHTGNIFAEKVHVLGDQILLSESALIDVSGPFGGGEVLITNANQTFIGPDVRINASALQEGDGGRVIVLGDEQTHFYGDIQARGGPIQGNGGFVELSGGYLNHQGSVSTLAPNGQAGTLLLDPSDLIISLGGPANVTPGPFLFMPTGLLCFPGANSILNTGTLTGAGGLAGGNVTVTTVGTPGGCFGDILILDQISWFNGNSLTIIADRNITVRQTVANNLPGSGALTLIANTGDITIDAVTPGFSVSLRTFNGPINVSAPRGNVFVLGGPNPGSQAFIGFPAGASTGNIFVTAGVNLVVQGGTGFGALAYIGRIGFASGPSPPIRGDLNINVGKTCNLIGGLGGGAADAFIGHGNNLGIRFGGGPIISTIRVNIGHNLDMMSGPTSSAFIGGAAHIPIQGDYIINVGEYAYLHNHPLNSAPRIWGCFIGTIIPPNPVFPVAPIYRQNLYLNVGRNLTLDARDGGGMAIRIANDFSNFTTQGLIRVHVCGDINLIGGKTTNSIAEIIVPTATIGFTNRPNTEVFAGGSIRCYNGLTPVSTAQVAIPEVPFSELGVVHVAAGGNIIMGAGRSASTATYVGTQTVLIEADATFAPAQLWPAQSVLINAVNIFAGTPLAGPSGNQSCSTMDSGGNGLGGFAVDTALYDFALPSLITGFFPILDPTPPAPPVFPGIGFLFYRLANDFTLLSRDRFISSMPADLSIGNGPNHISTSTTNGDITILAFRNITIDNFIRSNVSGDILIIANNDITMLHDGITTFGQVVGASDVTLVVDNQAPIRPLIGGVWSAGGLFAMDPLAFINSAGTLWIFTARQPLNSILGLLNGFSFFPGVLFVDTNLEKWCIYYPNGDQGVPFKIFYKECLQLIAQQATTIIVEFLTDLHPYDEFPGWIARFLVRYPEPVSYSEPYWIRRRNIDVFNHPKTWTKLAY